MRLWDYEYTDTLCMVAGFGDFDAVGFTRGSSSSDSEESAIGTDSDSELSDIVSLGIMRSGSMKLS